jgi:hypothetical protein
MLDLPMRSWDETRQQEHWILIFEGRKLKDKIKLIGLYTVDS